MDEKYYWTNKQGVEIPKHELSDEYVCHIVMYFGKNWLRENGHKVIVDRFEKLNEKYRFFEGVNV